MHGHSPCIQRSGYVIYVMTTVYTKFERNVANTAKITCCMGMAAEGSPRAKLSGEELQQSTCCSQLSLASALNSVPCPSFR